MADQVYLIPGGGLYLDTEQGDVVLVPGAGLVQEQEASGGATWPINRIFNGPFTGPFIGAL